MRFCVLCSRITRLLRLPWRQGKQPLMVANEEQRDFFHAIDNEENDRGPYYFFPYFLYQLSFA